MEVNGGGIMKKKYVLLSILMVALVAMVMVAATGIDGPRVDREKAKDMVREYINDSEAEVVYKKSESLNHGDYLVMEVENDWFYVNSDTGIIERVTFNDARQNSSKVLLSEREAMKRAEGFVKQKYGIGDMELVRSDLLDHGNVKKYLFIWAEKISGVETNRMAVSVNPNTGQIISFMGMFREAKVQLQPEISREKAIEIANNQFNVQNPQTKARLSIEYPEKDVQKLVWVIETESEESLNGGMAVIDAVSGEILMASPYK